MEFTKFFGKKVEKSFHFPHLVSTIKTMVDTMIADTGCNRVVTMSGMGDLG